jgi:RNA polymerase sigma-70 factor (ECF subfamily)
VLEYSGVGRLESWLRVIAVRTILQQMRHEKAEHRAVERQSVLAVPLPENDPETAHLRALYSKIFEAAFDAAVRELSPEDRNVLRAYYAQGLSIDQLGVAFGIHRATAVRRVQNARDRAFKGTRARLKRELKISQKELDSIMRLIGSHLELSLQRIFSD